MPPSVSAVRTREWRKWVKGNEKKKRESERKRGQYKDRRMRKRGKGEKNENMGTKE